MSLKGFGLSGYRSFGDELVVIAPLRKVNFIIGKNNSGKSNVMVTGLTLQHGLVNQCERGIV